MVPIIATPRSFIPAGISLSTHTAGGTAISANATLRFLSIVETARIPLHLAVGTPYHVTTTQHNTQAFFSSTVLTPNHGDLPSWWQTAGTDSPLGILAAVQHPDTPNHLNPRVTEILFYASKNNRPLCERPPTPPLSSPISHADSTDSTSDIRVCALPLSSDLLYNNAFEPTPPSSPTRENKDVEAVFLPPSKLQAPGTKDIVHELHGRKRRTANDAFDEANERKLKARRKGGVGVIAAAASQIKSEVALPTLKHQRSTSNNQPPLQTRPLSRASSVSSVRPSTAREPSVPAVARLSGLSKSQSASAQADIPEHPSTEAKNKEHISKVVMAGMRLQGLAQSKSRRSRSNSTAASPALDTHFEDVEVTRKSDEEYKLMYHQVYKGMCFAFRKHINVIALQSHTVPLQETVDALLAIYLRDPLASKPRVDDEFTPGGRKAFGSSALPVSEPTNPFLQAAVTEEDSRTNTPCMRKPKDQAKAPP